MAIIKFQLLGGMIRRYVDNAEQYCYQHLATGKYITGYESLDQMMHITELLWVMIWKYSWAYYCSLK